MVNVHPGKCSGSFFQNFRRAAWSERKLFNFRVSLCDSSNLYFADVLHAIAS